MLGHPAGRFTAIGVLVGAVVEVEVALPDDGDVVVPSPVLVLCPVDSSVDVADVAVVVVVVDAEVFSLEPEQLAIVTAAHSTAIARTVVRLQVGGVIEAVIRQKVRTIDGLVQAGNTRHTSEELATGEADADAVIGSLPGRKMCGARPVSRTITTGEALVAPE
ncbi:MAG: hypothetical protein AB7Q27_18365, partial [Acidimicrobiia bacterium]